MCYFDRLRLSVVVFSGVKYICEHYTAPLSCAHKPGTTLDVTAANYGRNSDTICVHRYLPSTGTCPQNPNALGIIQTLCQGMVSCDPLAENGIFTDTCPNVYKYLEIHCQCGKLLRFAFIDFVLPHRHF